MFTCSATSRHDDINSYVTDALTESLPAPGLARHRDRLRIIEESQPVKSSNLSRL